MPFNKLATKHSGTGTNVRTFPFQVKIGSDPSGNLLAKVHPGTVSGLLPANLTDPIYISQYGTYYIKLQVQTNGKIPTYVYIYSDSQPGDDEDNATEGTPPITLVIPVCMIVDKKPYQVIYSNQFAHPVFLFAQTTGDPDNPWTRWYGWEVNTA